MTVYEMIEAQQKGHEGTTVFTVGEHLKMICRADPACEQIVAEDLQQKGMGIADCEKKIAALADEIEQTAKNKGKRLRVGVDFFAAEDAIRKFYGLPERGAKPEPVPVAAEATQTDTLALDLGDLMGL